MFDIEFLRQSKHRAHFVHLYQDGCFRSDVAARVQEISDERGWLWQRLDPKAPSVASGGGVYDGVLIEVTLDEVLAADGAERTMAMIAAQIEQGQDTHFYIHGQGGGALLEWPSWDTVLNAATVLHEPRLGGASIRKILAYVGPRLAFPTDQIGNLLALERALRDWVELGGLTLPEFLSRLDVLVMACTDAATGMFQPEAFQEAVSGSARTRPAVWSLPIARFLRSRSNIDRMGLLRELDRALNADGLGPHEVMAAIWRATFDLAKVNEATNPGAGVVPDGWGEERWESNRAHKSLRLPMLLRWQTLLAHHEPSLLNRGVVAWDHLLRQVQGGVEKS